LFCDKFEITNLDYREFFYYRKTYELINPQVNLNIKPDTLVLDDSIFYGMPTSGLYWSHPAFDSKPSLGLTYQQVILFTKWRTDMVFEQFLIKQKVLPKIPMNMQAFTIEDYFAGNYRNIKPDPRYLYYFEYSLPSEAEWKLIFKQFYFQDALYIGPSRVNSTANFPNNYDSYSKSKVNIKNMQDEVSELLIDSNKVIGLNWNDSFSVSKLDTIRTNTLPSAYVGFRNIGKWIKWESKVSGM
jgi:hypothetical protein